jgi:hypothetical protein
MDTSGARVRAEASKRLSPRSSDHADVRARLGVVDQHGTIADPRDVGALCAVLGKRLSIVQPVDEGRLLAREVSSGWRLDRRTHRTATPSNALGEGVAHVTGEAIIFPSDADDDLVCSNQRGENFGAVEDEMGIDPQ